MPLFAYVGKVVWFTEAISTTNPLTSRIMECNTLFSPPDKGMLWKNFSNAIAFTEATEEVAMDAMRRFRDVYLYFTYCSVWHHWDIAVNEVSDHLTWLAEVVVKSKYSNSLGIIWLKNNGFLQWVKERPAQTPQLPLLAMGNQGGWELGYDSDLDLVFIHEAQASGSNGWQS